MNFYSLFNRQHAPTANVKDLKWEPRKGYKPQCVEPAHGRYAAQIYEKSRKWHDILTTTEPLVKLWSEKARQTVGEQQLVGLEFYPVDLEHSEARRLLKRPVPQFYVAKYFLGVPAIPYQQDGTTRCKIDPETGLFDLGPFFGVQKFVFDFSQWNGADFFYISTVYTAHRFCSQRFKDLVERQKLTNFVFHGARNEEGTEFLV